MAGVASPACIAGVMARGGVPPAPMMAGHPLSGLAERSLVARGLGNVVPADTAASGAATSAHQVFNMGKLSAQLGVSEHGKWYCTCSRLLWQNQKYLTQVVYSPPIRRFSSDILCAL